MSRGAHSFKQGDVTKAIKGAVKAGFKLAASKLKMARSLCAGDAPLPEANGDLGTNEWDSVK